MMKLSNDTFRLMGVLLLLQWGFIEGLAGDVGSCIEYVKVGCFRDSLKKPRPLPKLIENYRPVFNWNSPQESINSSVSLCAERVSKIGYTIFGLQFYGECWSGENATESFDRDGKSNRCIMVVNNEFKECSDDSDEACTGVDRTNYVYRIIKSVDGYFSVWSTWSQCSRTCGGGQKRRTRSCTNPPPSKCGQPCFGNTEEVVDCNTHSCPAPCEDENSEQCKLYQQLGLCDTSYPEVLQRCKKSCKRC